MELTNQVQRCKNKIRNQSIELLDLKKKRGEDWAELQDCKGKIKDKGDEIKVLKIASKKANGELHDCKGKVKKQCGDVEALETALQEANRKKLHHKTIAELSLIEKRVRILLDKVTMTRERAIEEERLSSEFKICSTSMSARVRARATSRRGGAYRKP